MDIKLKPCPFCGSVCLDYSEKSVHRDHGTAIVLHATVYCRKCHAYGRRVLSEKAKSRDYAACRKLSDGLREKAIDAWNRRADDGR